MNGCVKKSLVTLWLAATLAVPKFLLAQAVIPPQASPDTASEATSNAAVEQAFQHKKSHIQLRGYGHIIRHLQDDHKGSRHQRFLVTINAQQTLLVAHNIDLAPRVPLEPGDDISFSGEYIYHPKGGIMHWTHHDPQGKHTGGWIMHKGRKYH